MSCSDCSNNFEIVCLAFETDIVKGSCIGLIKPEFYILKEENICHNIENSYSLLFQPLIPFSPLDPLETNNVHRYLSQASLRLTDGDEWVA